MKIFILIAILCLIWLFAIAAYKDFKENEKHKKEEEKKLAAIPDIMPLFDPNSKCSACTAPNPYLRFVICGFQSSLGYSGEAIKKECCNCGHV
ncbi:MAG: hypothetical protein ACFFDY_00305 [Candidatus Thorarchaeota archaeon]